MSYELQFLDRALTDLERLDRQVARRILIKLRWLAENLEAAQSVPLKGRLAGLMKLRIGDYRAIYEIDRSQRVIILHLVGHRREIYREP